MVNAFYARRRGPCGYPTPVEAPAICWLGIAPIPSGNPRGSWIDVTDLPVTLAPYEHHSPLPSRHTSPRAAPGRALRTLRPRPRLHPRPHGLDQRHQRCGNAADGRQAERQAQAIERKVVLGLPTMPVQARAEVARPRSFERRSAVGILRWHAAEFWWLRRLRRLRGFGGNSKAQAALKQCASLQPKGGFPGGPGGAGGSSSTAFAAYRNCMKLHGVTVPSVTPGSSTSTPSTVDTSSPTYQAAQTACKALLPTGTGATPGSSG